MRFVADENINPMLVERLRQDGHQVYSIFESARGLTNGAVLELANTLEAILISEDKDVGELVTRLARPALGVVLIRLPDNRLSEQDQIERVAQVIIQYEDQLPGALTIIKTEGTRIRSLQLPPPTGQIELEP